MTKSLFTSTFTLFLLTFGFLFSGDVFAAGASCSKQTVDAVTSCCHDGTNCQKTKSGDQANQAADSATNDPTKQGGVNGACNQSNALSSSLGTAGQSAWKVCQAMADACTKTICSKDSSKAGACKAAKDGSTLQTQDVTLQGDSDQSGACQKSADTSKSGQGGSGGGMPQMPQIPTPPTTPPTPAATPPTAMTPPASATDCTNPVAATTSACTTATTASTDSNTAPNGASFANADGGSGASTDAAGGGVASMDPNVIQPANPSALPMGGDTGSHSGGGGLPGSGTTSQNNKTDIPPNVADLLGVPVADVLKGERGGGGGGGGGGGFSGYGQGSSNDHLDAYLPGGKKDPRRKLASEELKHPDISSRHEDIFQIITKRMQILCKLQELRDCH
jgi:hypothetical protein